PVVAVVLLAGLVSIVLQRRLSRPTFCAAPPEYGEPPLAVAGGGPAVPLAAPGRPPQDLADVLHPRLQQMHQQGPHLRHAHRRLFFPPDAPAGAPGTPTPAWTTPYGDASRPSPASRTRPGRTPP